MIDSKEKKTLVSYIKGRYPVGSLIFDSCRSEPYKVKKTSVFHVVEMEYSEEFQPENDGDVEVDFLVRDAGRYTELYFITSLRKKYMGL